MQVDTFKALLVEQKEKEVQASIQELPIDALPADDVLVAVAYSTLNYKDGLAVTGQGKVIRTYPMVPGIDLAGTVVESASPDFKPGDQVLVTGWGIGETHWGGYAQMARVRTEWLTPLPEGLTLKQAMGIGTAGFTAMLCVMALEEHGMTPGGREVVVTGASGGVGSVAVAILAKLGYRVVASTGRAELHDYLKKLGAHEILDRQVLATPPRRPMESERWGGAVDSVGGATLASLIATMAKETSIAACGVAGGGELNTTVFPFILRGVSVIGVHSVTCPQPRRLAAWQRLTQDLPPDLLELMMQEVSLAKVPELSRAILKGQVRGRVVIDVNV